VVLPRSLRVLNMMERLAAAVALVALVPLLALLGAMVAVRSGRSPWIRHLRMGWGGRPLPLWKLRTMWGPEAPGNGVAWVETIVSAASQVPAAKNLPDARVADRFATFCRRYSLDELPQLLHVVRGEMSLVGPRPLTRNELEQYYAPCLQEVLAVRPGITGLWQVCGRNRLTYAQRRRLDLFLVRRQSPGLYLRILLRSMAVAVSGEGAH
jgi:lipopolysaccharide/colanic/teichoic acid biosynthesis glycosyltransferase